MPICALILDMAVKLGHIPELGRDKSRQVILDHFRKIASVRTVKSYSSIDASTVSCRVSDPVRNAVDKNSDAVAQGQVASG